MKRLLPALALFALPILLADAAPAAPFAVAVTGGKTDQTNVVVRFPVPKDNDASAFNAVELSNGTTVLAQAVKPAQTDDPAVKQYLVFVLPSLKAGETITATPKKETFMSAVPPSFAFTGDNPTVLEYRSVKDRPGNMVSQPVLQYFNLPHDPADHFYTFKPFHNVYDPATGKTVLTNSSAKTNKDGLFPHHRGLFFGFNRVSYGDKRTADIWHGTDNVFSQHDKMLDKEVGSVLGRHRSAISWHGKDGNTFATEEREVTAYAVPFGTLLDWSTVLSTKLDKVRLDGDPQHAGFHFRAAQEVAKNGKANTYYLRPDGKGKIGETRNWDPKGKADPKTVNLPWNACSFVIDGKRYTVLRVNHPDNPKETRGSERDYGRFGDYFEYDLTPDKPLRVKYRVWVQEGEMTVEQCKALAEGFVSPPATKVVAGK
jgi:methane monooxygenase PmoA-like